MESWLLCTEARTVSRVAMTGLRLAETRW
jgi:hypothetical protein